MIKDTSWFPHDYEPTGDPKMQAMLSDYGAWGYGIYWRVAEMLHSDTQHKMPFKRYIYLAIAKQMQANAKQNKLLPDVVEISPDFIEKFIRDCIEEYELFLCDASHFWANRVNRNIEKKKSISEIRSKSGKSGANAKQKQANDTQTPANDKQTLAIREEKIREEYIIKNDSSSLVKHIETEKKIINGKQPFVDTNAQRELNLANNYNRPSKGFK